MLTKEIAYSLAKQWIAAWNAHDKSGCKLQRLFFLWLCNIYFLKQVIETLLRNCAL